MLNHVCLMGRLTRDPELRYTGNQTPVATFSIACDRDFNREEADFINCVAWRKTAEFVNSYFKKGGMIAVIGRLQTRRWKDNEDRTRTTTEVVVDNVYFGESKKNDIPAPQTGFTDLNDDGDLPF